MIKLSVDSMTIRQLNHLVNRLSKQIYKQSDLYSVSDLEQELAQRFCPNCPVARWRYTAALRGHTLYTGYKWEGNQKTSYCIWMFPPEVKQSERADKHIVAEAPSLDDLCNCRFNRSGFKA